MRNVKFGLALLLVPLLLQAAEVAEFDPVSGELLIPEVKVGQRTVYQARLRYGSNNTFTLQSFSNTNPDLAAQTPPISSAAAIEAWLQAGSYKNWACEAQAQAPRAGSGHTPARICSSPLLELQGDGNFPVGAASVKELFSNGQLNGYALGVKVQAGNSADSWFWYERIGSSTFANSTAAAICENCHRTAPRDRVFVTVP